MRRLHSAMCVSWSVMLKSNSAFPSCWEAKHSASRLALVSASIELLLHQRPLLGAHGQVPEVEDNFLEGPLHLVHAALQNVILLAGSDWLC